MQACLLALVAGPLRRKKKPPLGPQGNPANTAVTRRYLTVTSPAFDNSARQPGTSHLVG